jgi:hypothetical protein
MDARGGGHVCVDGGEFWASDAGGEAAHRCGCWREVLWVVVFNRVGSQEQGSEGVCTQYAKLFYIAQL